MAIKSGAAATGPGEAETFAGGGGGADSAPSPISSWTVVGGREVALGGLSLKESSPWGDAAGRRGTLADFLLLKGATPSESSSSDMISKTRFPLSRGLGPTMRPRPEERRQWAEESRESEAPQGYVGTVMMSLVELQ